MNAITKLDERYQQIESVLNAMTSEHSKRAYKRALTDFIDWHTQQGQPMLNKALVNAYKAYLLDTGKGASVVNQSLCAIRKLIREAADNGAIDPINAQGIANVKGVKSEALPAGRAISQGELSAMLAICGRGTKGIRDSAIIAILYACGLRRSELTKLNLEGYDPDTGELKIIGAKGNKSRTAYATNGAKLALDDWLTIRGNEPGALFLPIRKGGHVERDRLTTQAVYHILQTRAAQAGVSHLSPHDFRRSFVGDLLDAGADISTVQKMAGHADVSTTARYDRRPEETKRKAASLLHVPYFGNV